MAVNENFTKVVASKQMATIEGFAYKEGADEEIFMENAGKGVADFVHKYTSEKKRSKIAVLLCGKGNNGGDAHVAGRYLRRKGYDVVGYQVGPMEKCSPLCQKNYERLKETGAKIFDVTNAEDINIPSEGILVDALFGTGLQSAPREPYASIINRANDSELPIISVDIPSGLNGDSGAADGVVINASWTIFLGLPKKGFFLNQGWNHVGKLHYVDFGLPQKQIEKAETDLLMFHERDFPRLMPKIVRNQHKYQAGYVVGVAGSPGMPGAANLSASAALRAGAGIVRLLHEEGMEAELSSSIYELIKTPYHLGDTDSIVEYCSKATSVFIGPGLGMRDETKSMMKKLLPALSKPAVLDADALNVIAELNLAIPPNIIITPHIGEMRRLLHTNEKGPVNAAFLERCQKYVDTHHLTLVLKGGPTFVLHPNDPAIVIPYGNPGMATAGSGDVLTGIVAAMLAQGLTPKLAALCGVFAHARAGDFAEESRTAYSMTASDITDFLPKVFKLVFDV